MARISSYLYLFQQKLAVVLYLSLRACLGCILLTASVSWVAGPLSPCLVMLPVGPVYVPSGLLALCLLSQSIVCTCPSAARQHTFFRCFSYFQSWPCKVGLSAWLKAAGTCPFRQSLMVIFSRPLWAGFNSPFDWRCTGLLAMEAQIALRSFPLLPLHFSCGNWEIERNESHSHSN